MGRNKKMISFANCWVGSERQIRQIRCDVAQYHMRGQLMQKNTWENFRDMHTKTRHHGHHLFLFVCFSFRVSCDHTNLEQITVNGLLVYSFVWILKFISVHLENIILHTSLCDNQI